MEHTCDGIRWRNQYQNGKIWIYSDWIVVNSQDGIRWRNQYQRRKIWLNGDWIVVNSQERVLPIITNSFQSSILYQKRCLSETEICHYSKTLIWRRWFPLQFGVELVLSFEYYIQSIKVYHVSKKHSKCPIWIISDILKNFWRHMVTSQLCKVNSIINNIFH